MELYSRCYHKLTIAGQFLLVTNITLSENIKNYIFRRTFDHLTDYNEATDRISETF